jgi:anti-sigma factor RsiW
MSDEDPHLSDERLLLDVDGELSPRDSKRVRLHLDACWSCRARRQQLERAIGSFVRLHAETLNSTLPPAAGPRALLKAQLSELSVIESNSRPRWSEILRHPNWRVAATALLLLCLFLSQAGRHYLSRQETIFSLPDPHLTPGAASVTDGRVVCASPNSKNKAVPADLERKVFAEYRIANQKPQAYEVDYLVTPALGGSDDIRNLWPHSYSSTAWNARVKDALEDRLRDMVCDGSLDLTEAQHEISANWIAAYKKYFHTQNPLPQ